MSEPASNSPQRDDDESTKNDPAMVSSPDSLVERSQGESPTEPLDKVAPTRLGVYSESTPELGDAENADTPIRIGSPFAVDPFEHDPARPIEAFYDVGPLKYTAMGAVSASILIVGFGAAATYYFPVGGAMIAALGCLLSIFGMYSTYRLTAVGLLAIHLCLFVLSYGRSLS